MNSGSLSDDLYYLVRERIIEQLKVEGYSIIPPDNIQLPTSVKQAEAMMLVAENYLKGRK